MHLIFKAAHPDFSTKLDVGYMRLIWQPVEATYIEALEEVTGLRFLHKKASVKCGKLPVSRSGRIGKEAIWLDMYNLRSDGSFSSLRMSEDYIIATLTHELAHRLLAEHKIFESRQVPEDGIRVDHQMIYIFLYDSWLKAFGAKRANAFKHREAEIDVPAYMDAWKWAMNLTATERKEKTTLMVKEKRFIE
jgi:hypothetical protein